MKKTQYCSYCGSKLISYKEETGKYSPTTGRKTYNRFIECPRLGKRNIEGYDIYIPFAYTTLNNEAKDRHDSYKNGERREYIKSKKIEHEESVEKLPPRRPPTQWLRPMKVKYNRFVGVFRKE